LTNDAVVAAVLVDSAVTVGSAWWLARRAGQHTVRAAETVKASLLELVRPLGKRFGLDVDALLEEPKPPAPAPAELEELEELEEGEEGACSRSARTLSRQG
jgi:hypothetical protein